MRIYLIVLCLLLNIHSNVFGVLGEQDQGLQFYKVSIRKLSLSEGCQFDEGELDEIRLRFLQDISTNDAVDPRMKKTQQHLNALFTSYLSEFQEKSNFTTRAILYAIFGSLFEGDTLTSFAAAATGYEVYTRRLSISSLWDRDFSFFTPYDRSMTIEHIKSAAFSLSCYFTIKYKSEIISGENVFLANNILQNTRRHLRWHPLRHPLRSKLGNVAEFIRCATVR